jgi:hypothetical protein
MEGFSYNVSSSIFIHNFFLLWFFKVQLQTSNDENFVHCWSIMHFLEFEPIYVTRINIKKKGNTKLCNFLQQSNNNKLW